MREYFQIILCYIKAWESYVVAKDEMKWYEVVWKEDMMKLLTDLQEFSCSFDKLVQIINSSRPEQQLKRWE